MAPVNVKNPGESGTENAEKERVPQAKYSGKPAGLLSILLSEM